LSKNRLPTEWVKVTIGDLFCLAGGGTPETKTSIFWSGKIPWITSADIEKTGVIRAGRYVTAKGIRNSATHLVPKNTIIVATRVGLGKAGIASSRMCFSQDCQGLISDPALIDPRFSMYQLMQATQGYLGIARGTTISGITKKQLAETVFLLPPRKEQSRIVNSIDSLLFEIESATARLHRIKSNLKRYRASVLQAAVEGRLTAEWRKQNPPSETGAELLARILEERRAKWEENQLKKYAEQGRTPPRNWKEKYPEPVKPDITGLPELPEGWVWASADQLSPNDISNGRSVTTANSGAKVLRLTAVRNGYIDLSKYKFGDWSEEEAAPFLINEGDLLIVRGNGSLSLVGRIGIVKALVGPVAYPDTMIRLKVLLALVSSAWFARFWDSTHVRKHLEQRARTSAGIYKISQPDILSVPIAIAPIREQVELVLVIDNYNSIADAAETTVDSAHQRAARLRQSILKRAFEGRLVPQDPNDEPASVLLERIRAERVKQAATVKPARGKRKVKVRQADTSTGEIGTQGAETA
jgi:type I restriction enzyme S subunit